MLTETALAAAAAALWAQEIQLREAAVVTDLPGLAAAGMVQEAVAVLRLPLVAGSQRLIIQ